MLTAGLGIAAAAGLFAVFAWMQLRRGSGGAARIGCSSGARPEECGGCLGTCPEEEALDCPGGVGGSGDPQEIDDA